MFRSTWGIPILRMIDETGKIIKINSLEPIEFENNYFKGILLPMIKCEGELEKYNTYGNHLSKSNRKFEIQFQVSFIFCFIFISSYSYYSYSYYYYFNRDKLNIFQKVLL